VVSNGLWIISPHGTRALCRFRARPTVRRTSQSWESGPVATQPSKVLALLASRCGELVTREEIQREVWGDTAVVDFERGLNFAINRIRVALGDTADTPRFVATLPRRGYRFLYPVERIDLAANGRPEPLTAAAVDAHRKEAMSMPCDPSVSGRRDRSWISWAVALVAAIAFGAWGWLRTLKPEVRPVTRWTIALPGARASPWVALSPDGTRLAYLGGPSQQIFVRSLDQNEPKALEDTKDAGEPSFSPDGQWILYRVNGTLKRVPAEGGPSITIATLPSSWYGLSWADDGTILIGQGAGGLLRVPVSGGTPVAMTALDSRRNEVSHSWPSPLPGRKAALFTISHGSYDDAEIAVLELHTGTRRVLLKEGAHAVYIPTGHLVYGRRGSLLAVPFDLSRLAVKGSPVPVLKSVAWVPEAGFFDFTFSRTGVLAYAQSIERNDRRLVWVDHKGSITPLHAPLREYIAVSLAPGGRQAALEISGARSSIWTYDLVRGALTQLTFAACSHYSPVWKPDGSRLAYVCEQSNGDEVIESIPPDGRESPRELAPGEPGVARDLGGWSPDGKMVVFTRQAPGGKFDIYMSPDDGAAVNRIARPLIRTPADKSSPRVSPDGRWIAYSSDEYQGSQVFVEPFPDNAGGVKWRVSSESGSDPRWSPDGHAIFYRDGAKVMAVDVEPGPDFRHGEARLLFEGRFEKSYDIGRDGKRFLMIQSMSEESSPSHAQVVMEWFAELNRLVPPPR
jgi:serine/threonine-protein kinase